MAGSSLDREKYKVAIPQLSAQMDEIIKNNLVINRTVINLTEGKVSDLNSYLGYFQSLTTGYFTAIAGDIQYLSSREAYINQLKAEVASFGYLTAETADLRYATISNLNAATARIGALEADHVSVAELNAAKGRIADLEADHVSVTDLTAATGRITALESDHVSTTDLAATNAEVDHIKVGDLTIGGVTVNIYDLAMAIKSDAMASGTTWYKVSATTPSAPTAFDPTSAGWSQTEPSYTGGTTDSLYSCLRVVYADDDPTGTRHFQWSDVHKIQSWEAAKEAYAYASDANDYAEQAQSYAASALSGLSTVEDVVGVLNWMATHGYYESVPSTETEVVAGKFYWSKATFTPTTTNPREEGLFEYDSTKAEYSLTQDTTVVSGTTYYKLTQVTPVGTENPYSLGWLQLKSIDEAVGSYVNSHLALTDEGLFVMMDGSQWKVKIGSDGVYIIDPDGNTVNQMRFSRSIIGKEKSYHVNIDEDSIDFMNGEDILGYIANSKLNFPVGEITKQFYVAEKYVWRQTPMGALGLYLR